MGVARPKALHTDAVGTDAGIRPGTLSVGFVETFRVAVHGNSVAIGRMAGVTSQGDRIVVTPIDPANVSAVEKALAERNESRPMDA